MAMTQKHYNGLGVVLRRNLGYYAIHSRERAAVIRVCHEIGEWLEALDENKYYKKQHFLANCHEEILLP